MRLYPGVNCVCTPGVNCPCSEGIDCICRVNKKTGISNCPQKRFKIKSIVRAFDEILSVENETMLRGEADVLVEHLKLGGKIRVEGHADNIGTMDYNTRVSQGAAKVVHELIVEILEARGVSAKVLAKQLLPYVWFSYKCPVVPYSQRRGRTLEDKRLRDEENAPNRRVDIDLYPDGGVRCYVPLPPQEEEPQPPASPPP